MTASWPPAHSLPRCSYLSHRIGRLLLPALGWKAIGPVPTGMPKAVLIAAPHTSNWDFVWALLASWYFGLKIRWLGKEALFQSPLGWLLRLLGGVPVDRSAPHGLVGEVARTFKEADGLLLMVPAEGTRGYRDYWKSGFYYMAREAGVPVMMGYLDYETKEACIGRRFDPTGDLAADMDVIRAWYTGRTGKYPDNYGRIRLRQEPEADEFPPEAS